MSDKGLTDYPNAYSTVEDVERLELERRDKTAGNPNDYQGVNEVSNNVDEPSETEEHTDPRDRATTNEEGTLTNEPDKAAPIAGENIGTSGDGEVHDGGTVASTGSDHDNPTGS